MSFRCKDKDGIWVSCSQVCWDIHILSDHHEMKGCEVYVQTAISNPYQIYQDSANIRKKIIYKPFILPKPFHTQYLRVVIEYKRKPFSGLKGYVLSAFPCANIKKGDILIWTAI